jgi:hypothetical protein
MNRTPRLRRLGVAAALAAPLLMGTAHGLAAAAPPGANPAVCARNAAAPDTGLAASPGRTFGRYPLAFIEWKLRGEPGGHHPGLG